MLSIAQCRKIDPELYGMTDEELEGVLVSLYALGHLSFDLWAASRECVSKYPLGVQTEVPSSGTVK